MKVTLEFFQDWETQLALCAMHFGFGTWMMYEFVNNKSRGIANVYNVNRTIAPNITYEGMPPIDFSQNQKIGEIS